MNQPLPRRVFLMTLAASGAALTTAAHEKDAQAVALGYVADAKRADVKKYTKFVAGQNCASCALYQGKPADKAGGLPAVRRQTGGEHRLVQRLGEEGVNELVGREVPR